MREVLVVAALTYRRPDLLRSLLSNLPLIRAPEGYDVRYLIVDNDPEQSARAAIEDAKARFAGTLLYTVEPTPGIPWARNRALQEGINQGAKLLCFIDDDEVAEPDWLERMVDYLGETGSALVGGPIRRTLPNEKITAFQKFLGLSLIARRSLGEWRASKASPDRQIIYTGNWLCDLLVIRDHNLWFDTSMQYTGGTDAAFFFETVKRGLRVGWCSDAIVSEPIPSSRLTCGYIYGRGRAQGMVMAGLKPKPLLVTLFAQIPRGMMGATLLIIPALGMASFATGLHLLGSAVGHIVYLSGNRSELYARA